MNVLVVMFQAAEDPIVQGVWGILVMTGIVGIATTFIVQLLRKASGWLDTIPPAVKQLIVVVLAWGLSMLGSFLGITLPTELAGFTETTVQGLLASGFSMGFYTILKHFGLIKGTVKPPA
jgi:hypothetical protein